MKKNLHIAIDGPIAAGKGTVAAELAKILNILYIDTGAMYRAVALIGLKNSIDLNNENKLLDALTKSRIEFKKKKRNHGTCEIYLNGKNITDKIRTPEVSQGSSIIAVHSKIRACLVKKQQAIAKKNSVVMEGRDITTKVLPNADLKIYLTADQNERAKRRQKQMKQQNINTALNKVLKETKERDKRDTERKADPLIIAPDAKVIDSTKLSVEEVVEKIVKLLR